MTTRQPLRFRWDHRHPLHRTLVKTANQILRLIPLRVKYAVGGWLRRTRLPYSLVCPGDTVVQVGAPLDTLLSGRSRGMHLALRSSGGHAVIIEPDPDSAARFEEAASLLGLDHVVVVNSGAWNEATTLELFVDPSHPATNYIGGTVVYEKGRARDFAPVVVPVDTLDAIVENAIGAHGPVRVLSVTTNNSERQILQGIEQIAASGLEYLCLARTGHGYDELAAAMGFAFLGHDDRGYTYVRRSR